MEQLAIQLLARRTDSQTSHAAAERVPAFKARHEGLIYGAIFEAGSRGSTAKEIAAYLFGTINDVQVSRRLGSMGKRELIKRTKIGNTADGRPVYEQRGGCCVWRVNHG